MPNFPPASSEAVPATVAMATVLATTLSPIAFVTISVANFANAELMKPDPKLPSDSSEETPPTTPCAKTFCAADRLTPPAHPNPAPVRPSIKAALKSPPLTISPALPERTERQPLHHRPRRVRHHIHRAQVILVQWAQTSGVWLRIPQGQLS